MTKNSQEELLEQLIQEEIEKLIGQGPKYATMSEDSLRGLARRNLATERMVVLRKALKEDAERQCFTVGNLYGKTRTQILKEQEEET
jgi:hypothetical protein